MSTPGKLTGYGAVLAVTVFGAFGIGNAVGPVGLTAAGEGLHEEGHDMGNDEHGGHDGGHEAASGPAPESGGFHLGGVSAPAGTGTEGEIALTVLDRAGQAVTDFEVAHDQELHLVVVRSDGSHFAHVHPERDGNGEWTLPWTWEAAGTYRLYADVVPTEIGESLTLSATVQVAGDYQPVPLDETVTSVEVDGFDVRLDGELVPGEGSQLTITVRRDGQPVTTLEPYMGAFGHLTGLRQSDLAYLHVHPYGDEPQPGDEGGPGIEFEITAPAAGRYLLYLDFQVDGQRHTAGFVVDAHPASDGGRGGADEAGDNHDHGE